MGFAAVWREVTLKRFLSRASAALKRNRGLPIGPFLSRGMRFLTAAANARFQLRDCDVVGTGARVNGRPRIANQGHIVIGDDLILMSRWNPVELVTGASGRIEIGRGVALNFGTSIRAERLVSIGDDAMIGQYCILGDSDSPEPMEGAPTGVRSGDPRPITIGEGAWLAGRVTVRPGSSVGKGSVVTAGSVVDGDIPAGVLAAGIPARVVRRLNGEAVSPAAVVREAAWTKLPVSQSGLVLADFTADELSRRLTDDPEAPAVGVETAPFGQVTQTLMQGIPAEAGDFAVIWTRPETAVPSFGRMLRFETVTEAELLDEVDQFASLIATGCKALKAAFVPTWTLPPWQRGLGMLDGRPGGAMRSLAAANLRLAERLSAVPGVYLMNAQRWLDTVGQGAHSAKGWYLGKVPFGAEVFAEAARDVKAALRGISGQARKLLVLDLDDTLWGGIVGDAGWEGLRLGGHDGIGEAFVDFQRAIKALARRGVILAIVSKNEESVALDAIDKHPEMVLKRQDFVGWRINWQDKARNIVELASELRIGLQSVVFIDDNPVERARVREALPEVLVPEWPADKILYPSAFGALRCFDTAAFSSEDAARTQLYADEKKRETLRAEVSDVGAFLKSLQIRVKLERLGTSNLARTTQLLNKTNQMNLSTRRLTSEELTAWTSHPGRALWTVTVADKFGDAGLTGIVSLEKSGEGARLVDFILSCRVMGRKIENTMLHVAVEHARSLGLRSLEAQFLPTAKNKPCREFLLGSGLERSAEDLFTWDLSNPYLLPEAVELKGVS